jgi:hypothetical protein
MTEPGGEKIMTLSRETVLWLEQLSDSLEQELEMLIVDETASMSRDEIAAGLRSLGVDPTEIPGHLRQKIYGDESTFERAKSPETKGYQKDEDIYDLAAAEGQDTNVDAELDLLGNLVIDGISYEISENEEGYVYLHGAIPSNVTHLCLGNTLYPLKRNEDRADLCVVLIGAPDMGEFLDKHDTNPENYPATFKRNE